MRIRVCLLLCLVCASAGAAEPKTELLWPAGAPGAKGEQDNDKPNVTVYVPSANAIDVGVVVCPGGGYGGLAMGHEGKEIAEYFNTLGITAFVLKYRHNGAGGYQHPIPMQDCQRAIRLARSKAGDLKLSANKIGLMGFSAGGHLASTCGTHFDKGDSSAKDPIDQAGCRPDFLILCYPVVTLTEPFTHGGSKKNLLGNTPDETLVQTFSNEKQVTAETPPTFLFHTNEDAAVPAENSVQFYLALRKAKVPAEMHIYEKGKHGVGLASKDPILGSWSGRLTDWLKTRGLVK